MKAALYIRVSTSYQIDKDSLPVQRQDLINYAKYAFNIDDYEIFEDAGFSGKDTNRPAFQDMMKRIKNGEFSHLFVWKIDRVSRNLLDFCDMYEDLKKYNCTFVSKNEQFDTGSAMGEAMLKIILVFAELERKLTAERVTSIMLARAEKGLWNGARSPLGYDYDDKTKYPIINEAEAKTIKLIFNMYDSEKSTPKIAKYLNENKIKTKRGGSWTSKCITDIIRNPFYYGTLRYNYRQSARGKIKDSKEWIIKENNHPGIISKELWEKCNNIMDENAKRNKARWRGKNYVQHVFSGLLVCKDCGRGFEASLDKARKSDGYRPSNYRCHSKSIGRLCNSKTVSDVKIGDFMLQYVLNFIRCYNTIPINTAALENMLLSGDLFKDILLADESLNDTLLALDYMRKSKYKSDFKYEDNGHDVKSIIKDSKRESMKASMIKLERALERLTNVYLFDDKGMSEREYYNKRNDLETKIKTIKEELKVIEIETALPCSDNLDFLNDMNDFLLRINIDLENNTVRSLTLNGQRPILKEFFSSVIDKIYIEGYRVSEIRFKNGLIHEFIYK